METRIDFLQWLQTDMALSILQYLDDPTDLIRASAVSSFWRHFVVENELCKQLCIRMFPQLSRVVRVIETNCSYITKQSMDVGSSNIMEWEALDHRVYASLFLALAKFRASDCLAGAIGASSTDNYPEESIMNTLYPQDRVLQRPSYWSSKGHKDPSAPETLIYKLVADLCVITQINIKPFQADFQLGDPIYSAKSVRFRVGHPKSPNDIENDLMQLPLEQPADDKFIWTYTTKEFPMAQQNCLQEFHLPEPVLCIGGFLQIELLGRVQRQEMDDLFYMCVSHVQVSGRPLFPAFDIENLEPSSGKFSLKYNAEAFDCTLHSSSNGTHHSVSSGLSPFIEEEMLDERLGNLVQYLMQENEPDVYEWEDDDIDGDNEVDELHIL